jgi:hypothetical protein
VCTLTWRRESDGYQIFLNRDERRERKPAAPPAVRRSGAVRFLAPVDGEAGGTWIAVNDRGLSLCLLNAFPAAGVEPPENPSSRGWIPLHAIEAGSLDAVLGSLRALDLRPFRPFTLAALDARGDGARLGWSGRALEALPDLPPDRPLVSSSFCTEEVRRSREAVYRRTVDGAPPSEATRAHLAYHAAHDPCEGPYSPCMHRPDACTVSFSRIEVRGPEIRFHYAGHSPCLGLPAGPAAVLQRRDARADQ